MENFFNEFLVLRFMVLFLLLKYWVEEIDFVLENFFCVLFVFWICGINVREGKYK